MARQRKGQRKNNNLDNNTAPLAWIGLDISKATFDACLLKDNGKMTHKAIVDKLSNPQSRKVSDYAKLITDFEI